MRALRKAAIAAAMVLHLLPAAADDFTAVPVPAATLFKGDIIRPEMVIDRRYRVSFVSRNAFARSAADIVGREARRTLPGGRPIRLADLAAASLVREGEAVTARVTQGGLTIAARMVALDGGAKGAPIRLRNPETGGTVSGIVDGPGQVSVLP